VAVCLIDGSADVRLRLPARSSAIPIEDERIQTRGAPCGAVTDAPEAAREGRLDIREIAERVGPERRLDRRQPLGLRECCRAEPYATDFRAVAIGELDRMKWSRFRLQRCVRVVADRLKVPRVVDSRDDQPAIKEIELIVDVLEVYVGVRR